jgi:hypothetical protein
MTHRFVQAPDGTGGPMTKVALFGPDGEVELAGRPI